MTVLIVNKQSRRVPRKWLEDIAVLVMEQEGCDPETELSVVIGDDEWIQNLNLEYLKKARPTDVLAFPQDTGPAGAHPLLGDVAISAETAARQAEEAQHSFRQELALLLTHGILHLTGWRDNTLAERRRMMARSRELLARAESLPTR